MAQPYALFGNLDACPVEVATPAATGYTLRRYRDDVNLREPVFLGRDKTVFVFRSTANLVAFLRSGEPHDLVGMPDWEPPDWQKVALVEDIALTYLRYEQLPVCRLDGIVGSLDARTCMVDLDGEEHVLGVPPILHYPTFSLVQEFLQTHQVARELAEYAGLTDVLDTLAPESPLGAFERELGAAYFTKRGDRRRLPGHDTDALATVWSAMIPMMVSVVEFRD